MNLLPLQRLRGAGRSFARLMLEVLCILAIGHKAGEAAPRPTETLKWEKIHIGRYQMAEEPAAEA